MSSRLGVLASSTELGVAFWSIVAKDVALLFCFWGRFAHLQAEFMTRLERFYDPGWP